MSVVADIGLRLHEGIQELKLEQQLAPAREAVARTVAAGSANFFKAVEGVKGRWMQRSPSNSSTPDSPPVEVTKADLEPAPPPTAKPFLLTRQTTRDSVGSQTQTASPRQTFAAWGAGLGAFVSSRAPKFSGAKGDVQPATIATSTAPSPGPSPTPAPQPTTVREQESSGMAL